MNVVNVRFFWKIFFAFVVIFLCVLIDFFSKKYVKLMLYNLGKHYYINNFLQFVSVWNAGVSFGLLKFLSSAFISIVVLLILIFLLYIALINYKNNYLFWPLVLIIGGALGNLLDRLLFSAVFDFIDLHWNEIHWPTFNIADILISISAIYFIIYSLIHDYEKKNI